MLTIRLRREGRHKHPVYRIIVSEKARDPQGAYLESLGSLDVLANPRKARVNADRAKYWISQGAQLSDTVHNLFVDEKIIEGEKRRVGSTRPRGKEAEATGADGDATSGVAEPAAAAAGKPGEEASEPPAEAEASGEPKAQQGATGE